MMMHAIRSTRLIATKLQVLFESQKQRFQRIKSQILLNMLTKMQFLLRFEYVWTFTVMDRRGWDRLYCWSPNCLRKVPKRTLQYNISFEDIFISQ